MAEPQFKEEYPETVFSSILASHGFALTGVNAVPKTKKTPVEDLVISMLSYINPNPRHVSGLITALNNAEIIDYKKLYESAVRNNLQNRLGWLVQSWYTLLYSHDSLFHEEEALKKMRGIADLIIALQDVKLDYDDSFGTHLGRYGVQVAENNRGHIERKWRILSSWNIQDLQEHYLLYHHDPAIADRRALFSTMIRPGDPRYPARS